jgi:hypothetical protein
VPAGNGTPDNIEIALLVAAWRDGGYLGYTGPGGPFRTIYDLNKVIAPLRLAPGNRLRWPSWGLAPAVAAYRQFGVPAYLNDNELWLHGRRIAESVVERLGQCVVVASSFLAQFPAKCVPTPPAALEEAYRLRLEAQHGWQFEHSWPTRPETFDCAVA